MNALLEAGRLMVAERAPAAGVDREALIGRPARWATGLAGICRVTAGADERTIEFPLQPRSPRFATKPPG